MADLSHGGFLRDDDGALVVAVKGYEALPVRWVGGQLVDADGALVVVFSTGGVG